MLSVARLAARYGLGAHVRRSLEPHLRLPRGRRVSPL